MTEPRRVGRYVLGGELAAGGMATVHIGRLEAELGFSRVVAIKRLHAHHTHDPEFVSMLLDEGRLASRVRHAHVVPALDVAVHDGQVFLVMEYVPGESLASLLRSVRARGERVPIGVAVSLVMQVLEGLHAAHQTRDDRGQPLRIVHRDVSPQNVLVGEDGLARVLDFGIAKAVGRMQSTRSHELKGKLAYMAPEQLARGALDARTDLFAASIVLWELLTGARLFAADDELATCARVATLPIERAARLRSTVPDDLDDVLMRGLARDPDERWPSAAAMAQALEALAIAASPREVSAWLEELDTPTLARGRQLIADMHEAPTPLRASEGLAAHHPVARVIERAAASEAPTRKQRVTPPDGSSRPMSASRKRIALAGLLAASAALLAALALREPPVVELVRAPSRPAPQPAAMVAPVAPVVRNEVAVVEPKAAPALPRAQKPRPARPRARPKQDDCTVPFLLDEAGVRIPKRHCLE